MTILGPFSRQFSIINGVWHCWRMRQFASTHGVMLRHFNHFRTLRKWVYALFLWWVSDPKCKIDAFCASSAGCPYKVFVITDMMSLRKKSVLKMNFFDTRETSSVSWLFRVKCIEVKKRKLTQMVRHNRMNETECAATYPPLHFCVTKIKLTPRKKNNIPTTWWCKGWKIDA